MIFKIKDLDERLLNHVVALLKGWTFDTWNDRMNYISPVYKYIEVLPNYSNDLEECAKIIINEKFSVFPPEENLNVWTVSSSKIENIFDIEGDTLPVAAFKCYAIQEYGESVTIEDKLIPLIEKFYIKYYYEQNIPKRFENS